MPYEIPPWLTHGPSEIPAFLQAGASIGSTIAHSRAQAQSLSEQAREFDINAGERQKEFNTFSGLRAKVMEQTLADHTLMVEKAMRAKDYEIQTANAEADIAQVLNTTPPTDPEYLKKLGLVGVRYPAVQNSPVWTHAIDMHFKSGKLANEMEKVAGMNELSAQKLDIAQQRAQFAEDKLKLGGTSEQNISNQLAREEAASVAKTGVPWNETQRKERAAELGMLSEFKPGLKGGITFDENGRIQAVSFGDQPTVGTATTAQKNLMVAEKNYQILDDLQRNLRDSDLGVKGKLGDVVDKWAPQIGVTGFDPKRATNREALKVAVQSMVRVISSDSRFSNADRVAAEEAMVSPGWAENKQNANAVLEKLKSIITDRAKVDAQAGGLPKPGFVMTPDEITQAVKSGKMTKDRGVELRLKYYPEIYGNAAP